MQNYIIHKYKEQILRKLFKKLVSLRRFCALVVQRIEWRFPKP